MVGEGCVYLEGGRDFRHMVQNVLLFFSRRPVPKKRHLSLLFFSKKTPTCHCGLLWQPTINFQNRGTPHISTMRLRHPAAALLLVLACCPLQQVHGQTALFPRMGNGAAGKAVSGRACDGVMGATDSTGVLHSCSACAQNTEVSPASGGLTACGCNWCGGRACDQPRTLRAR